MEKLNETYVHKETGIKFDIQFNYHKNDFVTKTNKVLVVPNTNGYNIEKGFVFNRSNPETIKMIGKALQEIGEFCEKL